MAKKGSSWCSGFHGSPFFSKIVYLHAVVEIAPFIDNYGGVACRFLRPTVFRNLDADKPADIQLIMDGRRSNTTQIVADT